MSSPLSERLSAVVQEHTALKVLAASLKKRLNKAENKAKLVEAAAKKVIQIKIGLTTPEYIVLLF